MHDDHETHVDLQSLAKGIEELARQLRAEHSSEERTLDAVVHRAVELVPGAQHAAVSRVVRRRRTRAVETIAASSELPQRIDRLQYDLEEGPCWDAVWGTHVLRVEDLRSDDRWPDFGPRAVEAGISAMLGVRLYVHGDEELGALNVYAAAPGALTEDSEAVGVHVAAQASVALAAARQEAQLERALRTRSSIATATGMLAERYALAPDAAFSLMVRVSQERNVRVADLSEVLVTTRVFPPTEEQLPRRDR